MSARDGAGGRRAVIVGGYSQCVAAEQMLHAQIVEAAQAAGVDVGEVTVVLFVRKEDAGAVIGKQGSSLKEVRETSGAKIQLAREEVEGLRPCQISGSFQNVAKAQQMIYELVEPGAAIEANRQRAALMEPPPGGHPMAVVGPGPGALPAAVAAA